MRTLILVLCTLLFAQISFAGKSTNTCPLKKGGSLHNSKSPKHLGLLPSSVPQNNIQTPAKGTDSKG